MERSDIILGVIDRMLLFGLPGSLFDTNEPSTRLPKRIPPVCSLAKLVALGLPLTWLIRGSEPPDKWAASSIL